MAILARVSKRLGALARDVSALRVTLTGGAPPPVVARPPRPASHAPIQLGTREFRVVAVVRETANAVTLTVEDVSGVRIDFVPGQFFTLLVPLDGTVHRRAYSASSVPSADGRVSFTVKEAVGGRVSSHLVRQARVGDSWKALGPSGVFVAPTVPSQRERLVLVAGGSGITPILSIIQSVLASDPLAQLSLVYGNESFDSIIFESVLARLVKEFGSRLSVRHVLRTPPPEWTGGVGQLDAPQLSSELDAIGVSSATHYFVCGPAPMLDAAESVLRARGVPASHVHVERFASPPRADSSEQSKSGGLVQIAGKGGGAVRLVTCRPGETILDAALAAGEALPYSCSLGGCGACAVTVLSGAVEMDEPNCLRGEEREAGKVLTCVGRPCGPVTLEVGT